MTRHEQREALLGLVYESFYNDEEPLELLALASESRDLETSDYIKQLLNGINDKAPVLDSLIEPHLKKWTLDRLPRVTLGILRIAVYEISYVEDIPVSVSINEAVELAKQYGADEDWPFVNAILSSITTAIKATELGETGEKIEPQSPRVVEDLVDTATAVSEDE